MERTQKMSTSMSRPIDAYRARLDEARRRYFASQNEGDEPLGG
jgi:hypothetical protein